MVRSLAASIPIPVLLDAHRHARICLEENAPMFRWLACLLLLASLAKTESASDNRGLGHTMKRSSYTPAMRDGRCMTGHIDSSTARARIVLAP